MIYYGLGWTLRKFKIRFQFLPFVQRKEQKLHSLHEKYTFIVGLKYGMVRFLTHLRMDLLYTVHCTEHNTELKPNPPKY